MLHDISMKFLRLVSSQFSPSNLILFNETTEVYESRVSKYKLVDFVVTGTETFVCGGGNKSENEAYTPDNSGTSENSDNTVIFLPYKDETDHSRESSQLSAKSPDKSAGKFYITVYS